MGVLYVPLISCKIFINDTKISGGIMKFNLIPKKFIEDTLYFRQIEVDWFYSKFQFKKCIWSYWINANKEMKSKYQEE